MPEPEYGQRYCAFIDILGFSALIEKLDVGSTPLDALRDLLSKVHNPPPTRGASSPRADFRAQSISDAVALSAAVVPAGLGAIIHSINQLAVDLLKQGFFIRGALVKDFLYHDDRTVFGKALLRAYGLEATIVRYPRVMVTREVVEDIRAIDEKTYGQLLRRSEDGPMFIHVLRAIEMAVLPLTLGVSRPYTRKLIMRYSAADSCRTAISPTNSSAALTKPPITRSISKRLSGSRPIGTIMLRSGISLASTVLGDLASILKQPFGANQRKPHQ